MAVKGLDIFKLSPKKNCKECGVPTCMAFCMKVAQGALPIEKCPYMSDEAIALLSEATAPPMKAIEVGGMKLGGETVMMRHEKTFVNRNRFAVSLCTCMDDAAVDAKLAEMKAVDYERIGEREYVEFLLVHDGGDGARLADLCKKAAATERAVIIDTDSVDNAKLALAAIGDTKPVLNGANKDNYEAMSTLAVEAGVVLGVKGEAKGYVTLVLSDKLRTLLKMIPLPRKMSKTPDQVEEFNVYAYVKQLIDGNDVSVLLSVADEVVKVMDALKFYIPTLKDMSLGLKLSLEMIRRYLPEGVFSRIYLDEQPVDSGRYIAGAVALQSGDLNTAGVAMFRIKPKTEGVRLYWAEELPAVTLAEAEAHNTGALLESDGVVANDAKVTYTYKKKGLFSSKSTEFPTEPGTYIQTAQATGNYSCEKITRTIVIY